MSGFAGFECSGYPGDNTMSWLIANSNLVWCGYYLAPVPSHGNAGWMGKRSTLAEDGWGIAPVYVGQQVTGPGSLNPSTATGQADGAQAAGYMSSEGFAAGSYVYLDIENGPPFTQPQQDYLAAWSAAVAAGGYSPGVYCSHLLADQIATLQPGARIWAFRISSVDPGNQNSPFPESDPAGCGYSGAHAWQLIQDGKIQITPGGLYSLQVDLDTAAMTDPGAPDAQAPAATAASA
jgi:hypothetical protein